MKRHHRHSVIIGAGVMGCQLAYALCQRQDDVVLLEAGRLDTNTLNTHTVATASLEQQQAQVNQTAQHLALPSKISQRASDLPLALINPLRGRSARLQAIDLAGLRAMQSLEPSICTDAFMPTGVLRIASNKKQAKTWQKRLREYGTSLELAWLEPRDVPTCYHAPFGALLIVKAGYVRPKKLLHNLLSQAQILGLDLWQNARVQRLDSNSNIVYLEDSCIQAEHIFLCVGADKQGLQLAPDISNGFERIAGEIIEIDTDDTGNDVIMPYALAGAIYGMQQDAQVYIGGNHRPADVLADTIDITATQQLHKSASWFMPSLQHARIGSSWTGVRCKAATPLPVVHSITPHLHFVGALAGRGFLCAAHIAQSLADTLTDYP